MKIAHTDDADQYRDPDASGRWYTLGDTRFLSVTTAIRLGLPAPFLGLWQRKVVAEYADDNWPDLTRIREDADDGEFVKLLKVQPDIVRDAAGDFGTQVHDWAERFVLFGDEPDPEFADPLIVKRFGLFKHWVDTMKPEFIAAEVVCYSRRWGFAGTIDAIVNLPGYGPVIVDYKTGANVFGKDALQQTAYRHAEFLMVGGQEIPMPKTRGAFLLHIQKTQFKLVPVDTSWSSWAAFKSVLATAQWVTATGPGSERASIGQPVAKGKP